MTTQEAKEIMKHLSEWYFFSQGITEEQPKDFDISLTLPELIKANKKVEKWNKKQLTQSDGQGITQQMTFADRLLAATYLSLNYSPNEDPHIVVNMIGAATVQMSI